MMGKNITQKSINIRKTEFGKSSTNIAYKDLSIGKKLMKVIKNTLAKENGAPSP